MAPAGLPADVERKLGEAIGAIAADPEFHKKIEAQFTELDYADGKTWTARLEKARAQFSELWKKSPWSDAAK